MKFYCGAHQPHWLRITDFSLMVAHPRLAKIKKLPRARMPWVLDSGGFTEITKSGRWRLSPREYDAHVVRYQREVGSLLWAAPQDWMCEPAALSASGLSVSEHIARTVVNYLELMQLQSPAPYIPVLQGWEPDDYLRCAEMYEGLHVNLAALPIVGIGSTCRRQRASELLRVFSLLHAAGVKLHAFGLKTVGIAKLGELIESTDSMAWSYTARREKIRLPGHSHKNCANCLEYATLWRARLLASLSPLNEPTAPGELREPREPR